MHIRDPTTAFTALVILHVLAGTLLLQFYNANQPLMMVYLGMLFAQTSLLGIWAGLGTHHWAVRLVGIGCGLAYLVHQFYGVMRADFRLMVAFVFISIIAIAAVLLVIRLRVAHIQRHGRGSMARIRQRHQFSIRQLLLLTLVIGCILGIRRLLQPGVPDLDQNAVLGIISLCCVSVALPSVWSGLGTSDHAFRSVVVCAIAFGAGTVLTFTLGQGDGWAWWFSLMLADWLFIQVSLFVVRQCGFQLIRLSPVQQTLVEG